MKNFFDKYGSWAVVTGASSGIGEEFCRQLAEQKFNLVLIARRTERLQRLASILAAAHSIQTKIVSVDLGCVDIYRSQMSVPTKDSMLK